MLQITNVNAQQMLMLAEMQVKLVLLVFANVERLQHVWEMQVEHTVTLQTINVNVHPV